MGQSERTETDKKRARREKKQRQRQKQAQREKKKKLLEKMNPGLGNKYAKERAMKDLEKQSKQAKSGVTVVEVRGFSIAVDLPRLQTHGVAVSLDVGFRRAQN